MELIDPPTSISTNVSNCMVWIAPIQRNRLIQLIGVYGVHESVAIHIQVNLLPQFLVVPIFETDAGFR